ncbi:TIGR03943 family putative permease subunit [Pseudonocardia adelaidensis]|uniref:TIGR03943 family protein n=1 Tax=Pseudonocardia adelaidensis TaxID=648754 RepID=A0ABP9NW29_9PSEU
MNRTAQASVLFLLGGAVLYAGLTDLYLRYVKSALLPLLLASGAVLIVAAIVTTWFEWRRPRAAVGQHTEHEHREPRIAWLLVLPLLALIFVAPPPPGSYVAVRTGTALHAPWDLSALPAGDPVRLGLVDYAGRAVFDHGSSIGDRQITTSGFISLDEGGTPYLVRMVLNCCAADAQPVKVGLTGRIPPILQPDSWYEITGTYTAEQTTDPINNGVIPYIDVVQARPVPAPDDEYESRF